MRQSAKHLSSFDMTKVWEPVNQVSLLGAPFSLGQPKMGPENSPRKLRQQGLIEAINLETPWSVQDHGNLPLTPTWMRDSLISDLLFTDLEGVDTPHHTREVGFSSRSLYQQLLPFANRDEFLLTLGGDHSISLGTLAAILEARPKTKVIWVDAHADLNTPDTSLTGNLHGMVLGLSIPGLSSRELTGFEWLTPRLSPKDLVYIGLRDLDPMEKIRIHDLGIKYFTMFEIDQFGIGKVMEEVVDFVGDDNIHLSFDIDVCDPSLAPSTGTSVEGGITLREAQFVCQVLAQTKQLTSMDLVEINTMIEPNNATQTLEVAKGIVLSALGSRVM